MITFVLNDARVKTVDATVDLITILIKATIMYAAVTRHHAAHSRN
jgi:hypothetical protein